MAIGSRPAVSSSAKIVVLTILVLGIVLGGGFAAVKIRKAIMVRRALADGNAAFERGDWDTARKMLGRYIGAHPEAAQSLERYARAQLAMVYEQAGEPKEALRYWLLAQQSSRF